MDSIGPISTAVKITADDEYDPEPTTPAEPNPAIEEATESYFRISPIAFDLNGDGIKYQSLASSKAFFDIDGDKFAEHVEWLDKNDGFLARDLNGNGHIDGAQELFGETGGSTAYEKLAALDSNKDGAVTAADSAWGSLRVWQDANQNGRVEQGELKTLDALKITSVSLKQSDATRLDGHDVAGTSSIVIDGKTQKAADVLLRTDQLDSWYVGDGSAASMQLDMETLFLPHSRGYGTLASLPYAMTQNAALKAAVKALVGLNLQTEFHTVYDKVREILFQWSRHSSAEGSSHALKMEFLDALKGVFGGGVNGVNVGNSFATVESEMLVRLLTQGPLEEVFTNAYYDYAQDKMVLGQTADAILAAAKTHAPTAGADKATYWNEIARILVTSKVELGLTETSIMSKVDAAAGFKTYVVDYVGTSAADVVSGGSADGLIYALGGGGDVIHAGDGDDMFFIAAGSGKTSLVADGGNDTLVFGSGIDYNPALFTYDGTFYYSALGTGGNVVQGGLLRYQANGVDVMAADIERVVFADGTVKTAQELDPLIVAQNSTAGDDDIFTRYGGLTIHPGKGNDNVSMAKNSTITIDQGDGNDIINVLEGAVIQFGAGITSTGTQFKINMFETFYTEAYLRLEVAGGGSVESYITTPSYKMIYKFADGVSLTFDEMITRALAAQATDGNDTIRGLNLRHNVLVGGKGDDTLYAANNSISDRFVYNLGDGNDSIYAQNYDPGTLQLGSGIDLNHVQLRLTEFGLTMRMLDGAQVYVNASKALKFQLSDGTLKTMAELVPLALKSTDGADSIWGSAGHDLIEGGLGNDTLRGAAGEDTLIGGAGADLLHGGAGSNTVSYATSTAAVQVNLSVSTAQSGGDAAGDTIRDIQNLIGSAYDDVLTGNSNDNAIQGGAGNDTIRGDYGNDTIDAGTGNNVVDGGEGKDTLQLAGAIADYGVMRASHGYTIASAAGTTYVSSIEQVLVAGSSAPLSMAAFEAQVFNAYKYLASYADLRAAFQNDVAAAWQHYLHYGRAEGRDPNLFDTRLYLASNPDLMRAFGTDDIAAAQHYVTYGIKEGRAVDSFNALQYAAANPDLSKAFGTNEEALVTHYVQYGFKENRVTGDANLKLVGGMANDVLVGKQGDDTLTGGAGNDTLEGSGGRDVLYGGAGSDIFVFRTKTDATTAMPDRIMDFQDGVDHIDLRGLGFNGIVNGTPTGRMLGYHHDAANDATAITSADGMKIILTGHPILDASDFYFA